MYFFAQVCYNKRIGRRCSLVVGVCCIEDKPDKIKAIEIIEPDGQMRSTGKLHPLSPEVYEATGN